VKVISRSTEEFTRDRRQDLQVLSNKTRSSVEFVHLPFHPVR